MSETNTDEMVVIPAVNLVVGVKVGGPMVLEGIPFPTSPALAVSGKVAFIDKWQHEVILPSSDPRLPLHAPTPEDRCPSLHASASEAASASDETFGGPVMGSIQTLSKAWTILEFGVKLDTKVADNEGRKEVEEV
ncbi:hypothetical protein FRB96_001153 [Tulasnella sp. 330]|nr:hypothetical protein FRB96_001153 [Tulasnella sp. 330]